MTEYIGNNSEDVRFFSQAGILEQPLPPVSAEDAHRAALTVVEKLSIRGASRAEVAQTLAMLGLGVSSVYPCSQNEPLGGVA